MKYTDEQRQWARLYALVRIVRRQNWVGGPLDIELIHKAERMGWIVEVSRGRPPYVLTAKGRWALGLTDNHRNLKAHGR